MNAATYHSEIASSNTAILVLSNDCCASDVVNGVGNIRIASAPKEVSDPPEPWWSTHPLRPLARSKIARKALRSFALRG